MLHHDYVLRVDSQFGSWFTNLKSYRNAHGKNPAVYGVLNNVPPTKNSGLCLRNIKNFGGVTESMPGKTGNGSKT